MSRNLGSPRTRRPGLGTQSPFDPLGQSGGALPGGSPGRDGRLAAVREAKLPAASSPSGIAKVTRGSDAGLAADSGCYALVIYRRAAPVLVWRPAPECPDLPGPCADHARGRLPGAGQAGELDVTPADASWPQEREYQVRPAKDESAQQCAPQGPFGVPGERGDRQQDDRYRVRGQDEPVGEPLNREVDRGQRYAQRAEE